MADTYKTVLAYQNSSRKQIIDTRLTLEEAKVICKDKETSSTTCTKSYLKARTKARGPWFIGYEKE